METTEIAAALAELKSAAAPAAAVTALRAELATLNEGVKSMRIDIDDLALRRDVKATGRRDDAAAERKAMAHFVRTGDDAEVKTMAAQSNPDGGFTVLPQMARAIYSKTFDVSAMGRLARRITIDMGSGFEEPLDTTDLAAEWVAERQARPPLASPDLKLLRVPLHEVSTTQLVTQKLRDLASFDLGGWLEAKIADKFSRTEGAAFISGDGVARPKGLLTYPVSTADDAARPWGTIQYVPTGAAGAFATGAGVVAADKLVDLAYSLRTPYRARARWLMNSKTAAVVRKMRDGDGASIWAESLADGQPNRLLGYPVELDEEMPNIAADSLSIAFGDFAAAYTIAENGGVRLQRDPFTERPHVVFFGYRRVGGGLANSEAVKVLRFSLS